MEFIVDVDDQPHKATAVCAGFNSLQFVDRWRETLGTAPTSLQRDAVDLAHLARERVIADSKVGQPYIVVPGDIREHVSREPDCEVAGMILLTCDWFPSADVIGFCHFRRTWCNNFALDYLAKHPLTLGAPTESQPVIKGIGLVLLCFLSRLAVDLSCNEIWGEATRTSWPFYKKLFTLESVNDLFLISKEKFSRCAERPLDWQSTAQLNAARMETARELMEVEVQNPPLVGNRTVIVPSKRQLIEHFLELPRHTQNRIAGTLGLLREGDSAMLEDQWCRTLFQRASQDGKLKDLWSEVENRHEHGQPENNPFEN